MDKKISLSALTTVPAKKLWLEKQFGTLEVGKMGYLFITNNDYFDKDSKILSVWIDGKEYVFDTGQVLRGLVALTRNNNSYMDSVFRACNYISDRIQKDGKIQSDWNGDINENVHVYILPALLEAGQFLNNQLFYEKAILSLDYYKKNFSVHFSRITSKFWKFVKFTENSKL